MGEDEEVPSARNGKDSSLGRGITDSSQEDNTNNGENDQESRFNVRNETMSSSCHGHQEDDHNGRGQELGFPTSNTAETEGSSGINQDKGSGHRIVINETNERQHDDSGKQQLSLTVIGSSYQRDSVIINIEEITEAEGEHHYYVPEDELSNSGKNSTSCHSGESSQSVPDRFSDTIAYLKEMVAAMKGISENLVINRSLEETLKSQHDLEKTVKSQQATIQKMNIDLEARNDLEETVKSQQATIQQMSLDLEARNDLEETVKSQQATIQQMSSDLEARNDLEKTVKSQQATIQQMSSDLEARNDLEKTVKSQQATIQKMSSDLEEKNQIAETETEIQARHKQIEDEENKIHDILETSLERSIITMASFFVAYHSLLAYSQQPKNDLLRFILILFLIAMIWGATIMLLVIWWLRLQGIGERIVSIQTKRLQRNLPRKRSTTLKWHLFCCLIVFLGIFATGFTLYFVCITYSLWSTPASIASPPSTIQLLPTIQQATQGYFSQ